jgi:hypothetical protein
MFAFATSVSTALFAQACFQPRIDADQFGDGIESPSELFAPDANSEPVCTTPDPSPLTTMRVRVRTTAFGGRFAPRNVGAIWIEDAAGGFVKTVERWGETRARWLTRWLAASGGDVADAVTGATRASHERHAPIWDLTDRAGCEVPAGDYRVWFELTDKNAAGATLAVPIDKADTAARWAPPDVPTFRSLALQLE